MILFKSDRRQTRDSSPTSSRGFTLVELLVSIGIISILVALVLPAYEMARQHAYCSACAGHMKALAVGFMTYSNDNEGDLPPRAEGPNVDKWPILLLPYVGSDPGIYTDPGDPVATKVSRQNLISNTSNNSSFFFNGFSDLGFYTNPTLTVRMNNLENTSNLILLGQKVHGSTQYYMDFVEGNENDVLNKQAYFGGSNYAFADGSVRFLFLAQYDDKMWLVNKSYAIPSVPGH